MLRFDINESTRTNGTLHQSIRKCIPCAWSSIQEADIADPLNAIRSAVRHAACFANNLAATVAAATYKRDSKPLAKIAFG